MKKNEIRSLIIDDEEVARENIAKVLRKVAPDVKISGYAFSALSGIQAVKDHKPELIFLDIEMSDGDGFAMLDAIDNINFDVIFVTAHKEFAIRAIKYEALDFLVKPLKAKELSSAVERYRKRVTRRQKEEHRLKLIKTMSVLQSKVPVPGKDGIRFIKLENIFRFQADGSYTTIYTDKERPIVVSRPMKFYVDLLGEDIFVRVHRSHFVNMKFVIEFKRERSGAVILENGERIVVAEKKKEMVLNCLTRI